MSNAKDAAKYLPLFTEMLEKDTDPLVRAVAARCLGRFKYQLAVPTLIRSLEDQSPVVRQDAAVALGQIADKSAVPALLKSLDNDTSADVRRIIAQLLRPPYVTGPEPAVVDMLVERLNDINRGVGFAAYQSLQQLTKQEMPFDAKEWEKWRDAQKGASGSK